MPDKKRPPKDLVCTRCGNPATAYALDDGESHLVCFRHPKCMKITPAEDISPPWAIFANSAQDPDAPGKSVAIMPAMRLGDVINVELVPDAVVAEVVLSVSQRRMPVEQALDVIRFHQKKATMEALGEATEEGEES